MRLMPILLTAIVAVAGCAQEAEPEDGPEPNETMAADLRADQLVATVEGLRFGDLVSGEAALFGLPREAAEEFVEERYGAVTDRHSSNTCGAGPMEFSDFGDLTINFQGGLLVGWSLVGSTGDPPITTPNGLTVGSTRLAVEQAPQVVFEETSLGMEFTADGVDGVMSNDTPDGIVTNLWAGTICALR